MQALLVVVVVGVGVGWGGDLSTAPLYADTNSGAASYRTQRFGGLCSFRSSRRSAAAKGRRLSGSIQCGFFELLSLAATQDAALGALTAAAPVVIHTTVDFRQVHTATPRGSRRRATRGAEVLQAALIWSLPPFAAAWMLPWASMPGPQHWQLDLLSLGSPPTVAHSGWQYYRRCPGTR